MSSELYQNSKIFFSILSIIKNLSTSWMKFWNLSAICQAKSKSTLTPKKRLTCSLCDATFSKKSNLNDHTRRKHTDKSQVTLHKCDKCSKQFTRWGHREASFTISLISKNHWVATLIWRRIMFSSVFSEPMTCAYILNGIWTFVITSVLCVPSPLSPKAA